MNKLPDYFERTTKPYESTSNRLGNFNSKGHLSLLVSLNVAVHYLMAFSEQFHLFLAKNFGFSSQQSLFKLASTLVVQTTASSTIFVFSLSSFTLLSEVFTQFQLSAILHLLPVLSRKRCVPLCETPTHL